MKTFFNKHRLKTTAAFSLVEVVLALGIVSMLLAATMVILGAITLSSRQVIGTDNAMNALSTVGEWFQEREFGTVYRWARDETDLYLYAFRSLPSNPVPEGGDFLSAEIAPGDARAAGLNYVLYTALRPADDPKLAGELAALEGRLYRLRLEVGSTNPGGATLPAGTDYTRGYLALNVNVTEIPGGKAGMAADPVSVVRFPVIINR